MLTHANHRQVRDFILQYPKMDFTPVTLSMVLRDLVAKVIDLVGELFLRLRSLRPLTVIKDPATTFAAQIEQGSNIVSVISRLQRFQRLDPALFEEYKTQLEKTHPEVVLDTDFLTLREVTTDEKIPQLFDIDDQGNKQKSLVLIPLVLEGALENHIVLLAYDVKNKIAYYYDSKGKPIRASQERCLAGSTFTLGYFIEERFKDTYVNAEVL